MINDARDYLAPLLVCVGGVFEHRPSCTMVKQRISRVYTRSWWKPWTWAEESADTWEVKVVYRWEPDAWERIEPE